MDDHSDRQESVEVEDVKGDDREPNENGSSKTNKKKSKRTKTGCLTCRRRRIKCGEERPTCQNCTKSKRQCEGYNQRVVFKDPLSAYRGPPFSGASTLSYATEPYSATSTGHPGQEYQQTPSAPAPLLTIAPKPPASSVPPSSAAVPLPALPVQAPGDIEQRSYTHGGLTEDYQNEQSYLRLGCDHISKTDGTVDTIDHSHLPEPNEQRYPQTQASHYDFDALQPTETGVNSLPAKSQLSPLYWSSGPSRTPASSSQELYYDSNKPWATASTVFHTSYQSPTTWPLEHSHNRESTSALPVTSLTPTTSSPSTSTIHRSLSGTSDVAIQRGTLYMDQEFQQRMSSDATSTVGWGSKPRATSIAAPQYYPVEDDDDLYDVDDEDEVMMDDNAEADYGAIQERNLKNNDLGIMVALQARQDTQEIALRSYTSFIDRANMLATYNPSPRSSPLRDAMTARIFCHFINVTGPSISMFERHPANPSLVFQGRPVPKSQQHIWSYTFPILALENQALLHAMLALASLHIAKLQNGPITSSLKHYAIALRRIAKSVSLPARRGQPATLAATMLLGFYDCWCADHQKWSNHLLGAKQLVREIDFAGISKYIRISKTEQRRYRQQSFDRNYDDRSRDLTAEDEVDENIVSMLLGKRLRYDQYGHIIEEETLDERKPRVYTQMELDIYENQRDLFWWYCKQDVYQSMLGGGKLFMDYSRWGQCPPRAPLGRLSSIYGTFDHLILLMGRVADFAAKDLKRKKKVVAVNGGWRPPGTPMPPPNQSSQATSQHMPPNGAGIRPPNGAPPAVPSFAGMMPDTYEAKLPMGFTSSGEHSPQSTRSEEIEFDALQALTTEAEEEWQEIRSAFTMLEDNFGRDFQALGPEYSTPIQTPFGTALNYRTYGIAGIWLNYYMGLIACHRAHPCMPPAAMMAAGIAARQTAQYANEVGRIAAGIAPDISSNTVQVNTGVGAAIIEASLPLFFAAVQYQDAAQRAWTVGRLRDTSRLTGWQSANAVLRGCESSWIRLAELGRGPPYSRSTEENSVAQVWSHARRIDLAMAEHLGGEQRLVVARTDRAHYALGVLGFEEDFSKVDLCDDDDNDVPESNNK